VVPRERINASCLESKIKITKIVILFLWANSVEFKRLKGRKVKTRSNPKGFDIEVEA